MSRFQRIQTKFDRRGYYVDAPNEQFQIDLVDLTSKNAGFMLNCIDVFSRYMHSVKLKNKSKEEIKRGLEEIFNKMAVPKKIQSDMEAGLSPLKEWLQEKGVELFHIEHSFNAKHSAPHVERLNRTMRDFMYDLKDKQKAQNWTQVSVQAIRKFPKYYNRKEHSSINMKPETAYYDQRAQPTVRAINYKHYTAPRKEPPKGYKVGDFVYVAKPREAIRNKFTSKYTDKPFMISSIVNTNPTTYKLDGKNGSYYAQNFIKK